MSSFLSLYGNELIFKLWEHVYISFISLALGTIVAVPLGVLLSRMKRFADVVIRIVSILQTIPSLALLSLMIPFFGIGKLPSIIALFLYSLLPILRNTYVGIKGVNPVYVDAAKGMGMTEVESIFYVELPIAYKVILSGIRLSAVYVISWTTLASYIGAGGLGDFIFNGLNLYQADLILGGAIPVTLLALIVDFLLNKVERIGEN